MHVPVDPPVNLGSGPAVVIVNNLDGVAAS